MENNFNKVFIDTNGELNCCQVGRLATIEDLEEELAASGQVIEGILQLANGVYYWQSSEQQRKVLENDEDIEPWELEECVGEYIKVNNDVPLTYKEFLNDLEEVEEVLSCTFTNSMLFATTRMYNNKWVYTHNYSMKKGKIEKSTNAVPTLMIAAALINVNIENLV